jgi:SAM-dependent methyltransferase
MVNKHRWQRAQRAEFAFWRLEAQSPRYFDPKANAHETADRALLPFGLDSNKVAALSARVVLEVGCGPYGLIHYLDTSAMRVGFDPLMCELESAGYKDRRGVRRLQAVGEHMPISSDSVDLVICYNVLDHMASPARGCAEIARVLRTGGCLLFQLHVFPQWIQGVAAGILGMVDTPHPYHFSVSDVRRLLIEAGFQFETMTVRRRNAWRLRIRDLYTYDGIRHLASNLLESVIYIRAVKAPTVDANTAG